MNQNLISQMAQNLMKKLADSTQADVLEMDPVFQKDQEDAEAMEQKIKKLQLSDSTQGLLNDYIACLQSSWHRYGELRYLAGMNDAISVLEEQKKAEFF